MNKVEFFRRLRKELNGLPKGDIEERLTFYGEMIDDRIEEGLSEEEAVAAVGSVEKISEQIISDISLVKIAKERIKSQRRLKVWEVLLLILGCPLWLPLCIAAGAVVLSVYVSLWSVIISLWAVFASLVGCLLGGFCAGLVFICNGNALSGIAIIAVGMVCAGLSVFAFFGCRALTKGFLLLTKNTAVWIKNAFIRKEEV